MRVCLRKQGLLYCLKLLAARCQETWVENRKDELQVAGCLPVIVVCVGSSLAASQVNKRDLSHWMIRLDASLQGKLQQPQQFKKSAQQEASF